MNKYKSLEEEFPRTMARLAKRAAERPATVPKNPNKSKRHLALTRWYRTDKGKAYRAKQKAYRAAWLKTPAGKAYRHRMYLNAKANRLAGLAPALGPATPPTE